MKYAVWGLHTTHKSQADEEEIQVCHPSFDEKGPDHVIFRGLVGWRK